MRGFAPGRACGVACGADLTRDANRAAMLALAAMRPVCDADWIVVGSSGTAVRAVVDWNGYARDGHVLDQPDTTKQVALPTSRTDFLGRLCLAFTGAEVYQSTRAAASWGFACDGVSCTSVRKLTPLAGSGIKVADMTTTTSGSPGHQFFWNYPTDAQGFGYLHGPASGGIRVNAPDVLPETVGTPAVLTVRLQAAATQYRIRANGAQVASGAYAAAMSATPVLPLTLGANAYPTPSLGAPMRWRGIFWGPVLGDSDTSLVESVL